jgi:hypothetical protein
VTESGLQWEIINWCRVNGLLVHTCNLSVRCTGKGFPDLIIASTNGVIWAELKAWSASKVKPEQTTWAYTLKAARQHYCRWTIADWDNGTIQRELTQLL